MWLNTQGFPGAVELDLLFSPGGQIFFTRLHVRMNAFTGNCDIAQE